LRALIYCFKAKPRWGKVAKDRGYAANFTSIATVETQSGMIVHSHVVIGNVEQTQFGTIVKSVASGYDDDVKSVIVDSAYTKGANLTEGELKEIELTGPLAEVKCDDNPANRDDFTEAVAEDRLDDLPINPHTKRFDHSTFVYDEQSNQYYCPAGQPLHCRTK